MFALLTEISLRHWLRSALRSLLVVFGIGLGVALYVATESTSASMLAAFCEIVASVSGRAELTVQASGGGVPSDLVASIADVPGVGAPGGRYVIGVKMWSTLSLGTVTATLTSLKVDGKVPAVASVKS